MSHSFVTTTVSYCFVITSLYNIIMESLRLPTTAAQAKAFVGPNSLSYDMNQANQRPDAPIKSSPSLESTDQNADAEADEDASSGIVPTLQ